MPFDIVLYEKDKSSKIEFAQAILKLLPKPINQGYFLVDSWYSCEDLFNASAASSFYYLGALKSSRKTFHKRS